jgi:hypothetical protein
VPEKTTGGPELLLDTCVDWFDQLLPSNRVLFYRQA